MLIWGRELPIRNLRAFWWFSGLYNYNVHGPVLVSPSPTMFPVSLCQLKRKQTQERGSHLYNYTRQFCVVQNCRILPEILESKKCWKVLLHLFWQFLIKRPVKKITAPHSSLIIIEYKMTYDCFYSHYLLHMRSIKSLYTQSSGLPTFCCCLFSFTADSAAKNQRQMLHKRKYSM